MSELSSLTLLSTTGPVSLWKHTEAIQTEFVAGIKLEDQEPIFYEGEDCSRKFTETELQLPTTKAERLVLLFRKLYSSHRDTNKYDCLSGLDFICGVGSELQYKHRYKVTGPTSPDSLTPGEPHVVLSNDRPIHGILATDNTNALHVAGPYSDLAYSPAADILRIWQGDLVGVTTIKKYRT